MAPDVAISAKDQILGFGLASPVGDVSGETGHRKLELSSPELLDMPLSESFLSLSESPYIPAEKNVVH